MDDVMVFLLNECVELVCCAGVLLDCGQWTEQVVVLPFLWSKLFCCAVLFVLSCDIMTNSERMFLGGLYIALKVYIGLENFSKILVKVLKVGSAI